MTGPSEQHALGAYVAGDVIADKYRLDVVLGRGGMGTVWRARNLTLDVDVAVKLIRREAASDTSAERLLVEARAAARIRHPSIVAVYDFGRTSAGDPFIVMEVVEGESLANLLDRKVRVDALTACKMLLPIAHALAAVHRRGIVHRDLKPENIILAQADPGVVTPKLVDFGVAKVLEGETKLTRAGGWVGSPGYMAPEQIRERDTVDERADVWAFAVVFYEIITGRPPFEGESSFDLFQSITGTEPVPTTDLGAGDRALWEILKRGLAKSPADRWPTIASLGAAIAQYAIARGVDADVTGVSLTTAWSASTPPEPPAEVPSSQETIAPPTPRVPRRVIAAALIGVGALAAVAVALAFSSEPRTTSDGSDDAASRRPTAVAPSAVTPPPPPPDAPPVVFADPAGAAAPMIEPTPIRTSTPHPARRAPAPAPRATAGKQRPQGGAIDPGF